MTWLPSSSSPAKASQIGSANSPPATPRTRGPDTATLPPPSTTLDSWSPWRYATRPRGAGAWISAVPGTASDGSQGGQGRGEPDRVPGRLARRVADDVEGNHQAERGTHQDPDEGDEGRLDQKAELDHPALEADGTQHPDL